MKLSDNIAFIKEVANLNIESDISHKQLDADDVWLTPDGNICSLDEAIEHFNTYGDDVATFEFDAHSNTPKKEQFIAFIADSDEKYQPLSEDEMFAMAVKNLENGGYNK